MVQSMNKIHMLAVLLMLF